MDKFKIKIKCFVYHTMWRLFNKILLSNNWGIWWICDADDGNDDDDDDDCWSSEFDDIDDCRVFGK
jgi:hypothetical protein